VKYVDALVGSDTINTMPLPTLLAYDDHGDPAPRLRRRSAAAAEQLKRLRSLGIDLGEVCEKLLQAGLAKFRASYDEGLAAVERKRAAALGR
jgi:transaldolase